MLSPSIISLSIFRLLLTLIFPDTLTYIFSLLSFLFAFFFTTPSTPFSSLYVYHSADAFRLAANIVLICSLAPFHAFRLLDHCSVEPTPLLPK